MDSEASAEQAAPDPTAPSARRAVIIGSAPVSEGLRAADLSGFTRIALHRAWALRRDFHIQVGLAFMSHLHEPPADYPLRRIRRADYNPVLDRAGGNFLCAPSVALVAGYWAIAALPARVLIYHGCDLVYAHPDWGGRTHFYGKSDPGPLLNAHPCMRRQDLKSVRLFVWGLLHRVAILNASGLPGSLLGFPVAPLDADHDGLYRRLLGHRRTNRVLIEGAKALAAENRLRTPAFDGRWRAFARDADALARLERINAAWEEPARHLAELRDSLGMDLPAAG